MRPEHEFDKTRYYQIRVRGHLDQYWTKWLDAFDITCEQNAISTISVRIIDQPQLHGLLIKIRDLGLTLVSILEIEDE